MKRTSAISGGVVDFKFGRLGFCHGCGLVFAGDARIEASNLEANARSPVLLLLTHHLPSPVFTVLSSFQSAVRQIYPKDLKDLCFRAAVRNSRDGFRRELLLHLNATRLVSTLDKTSTEPQDNQCK